MTGELKVAIFTALFLTSLGAASLLSALGLAPKEEVPSAAEGEGVSLTHIIVPVSGVTRSDLKDTWGAPRGEGRAHKGIDIFAEQGTEVYAAAPGKIVKLFLSKRGGITIYQADKTGKLIFYYAHLHGYANDLKEGMDVFQGQTLGYVGKSGNAPVPHLHFEILSANERQQWWKGTAMNPFPLLKSGRVRFTEHAAQSDNASAN